jgi:hypothetical protein
MVPNLDIASNASWDLILVADVQGNKSRYTPRSDASLCINRFPHLILEIISNQAQSDCNRVLLQAACLARLGNALRQDPAADPFIVSAIYIDDQLRANWYLIYQPEVSDTAVGLFLQEAVRYLRLGRLSMSKKPSSLQMPRACSTFCFDSTTLFRWPMKIIILYAIPLPP